MQRYSWSHCSRSAHSASRRARKCSRDSLRPVFLLMRSTRPSATAFSMGTSWRDQQEPNSMVSAKVGATMRGSSDGEIEDSRYGIGTSLRSGDEDEDDSKEE